MDIWVVCIFGGAIVNNIAVNIHVQDFVRGTSLAAQWLRICLPTQGTRV